jgi:hypothetical protein
VADFLEIAAITVNPLIAGPEQVVALDAHVVLLPADLPEEQRPRLAIHPYPLQRLLVHRAHTPDPSAAARRCRGSAAPACLLDRPQEAFRVNRTRDYGELMDAIDAFRSRCTPIRNRTLIPDASFARRTSR